MGIQQFNATKMSWLCLSWMQIHSSRNRYLQHSFWLEKSLMWRFVYGHLPKSFGKRAGRDFRKTFKIPFWNDSKRLKNWRLKLSHYDWRQTKHRHSVWNQRRNKDSLGRDGVQLTKRHREFSWKPNWSHTWLHTCQFSNKSKLNFTIG